MMPSHQKCAVNSEKSSHREFPQQWEKSRQGRNHVWNQSAPKITDMTSPKDENVGDYRTNSTLKSVQIKRFLSLFHPKDALNNANCSLTSYILVLLVFILWNSNITQEPFSPTSWIQCPWRILWSTVCTCPCRTSGWYRVGWSRPGSFGIRDRICGGENTRYFRNPYFGLLFFGSWTDRKRKWHVQEKVKRHDLRWCYAEKHFRFSSWTPQMIPTFPHFSWLAIRSSWGRVNHCMRVCLHHVIFPNDWESPWRLAPILPSQKMDQELQRTQQWRRSCTLRYRKSRTCQTK